MSDEMKQEEKKLFGHSQTFRTAIDTKSRELYSTNDTVRAYGERSEANMTAFFQTLKSRYHDKSIDPSVYTPPVAPVYEYEKKTLEMPKLSYKDRKKKKEVLKKADETARAAAKKQHQGDLYKNATKYTAFIAQEAKRKLITDENPQNDMYTYEENRFVVGSFEPKDLYRPDPNPEMFRPEFFTEHFSEVMDNMQELREMLFSITRRSQAGSITLTPDDQDRFQYLKDLLVLMEKCYDKALATQSIKRDQYRDCVVSDEIDTGVAKDELEESIDALYKKEQARTEKISKGWFNREYLPIVLELEEKGELKVDPSEKFFEDLDEPLNDVRVQKNEAVITPLLADLKFHGEQLTAYKRFEAACETIRKKIVFSPDGSENKVTGEDLVRLHLVEQKYAEVQQKIAMYSAQMEEMKNTLEFLINGKGEITDAMHILLLRYDYAPEKEKQTKAETGAKIPDAVITSRKAMVTKVIDEMVDASIRDLVKKEILSDPLCLLRGPEDYDESPAHVEETVGLIILLHRENLKKADPSFEDQIPLIMQAFFQEAISDEEYIGDFINSRLRENLSMDVHQFVKTDLKSNADYGTPDSLIAQTGEFMGLNLISAALTRLATIPDLKNPGLSLRDSLADTLTDRKLLVVQQTYADSLYMQSRGATLLATSVSGMDDPLSLLTEEERREVATDTVSKTDEERFYVYAQRLITDGKQLKALADGKLKEYREGKA